MLQGKIAAYAREPLKPAGDHARVRAAQRAAPRVSVEPVLPADLIALCPHAAAVTMARVRKSSTTALAFDAITVEAR